MGQILVKRKKISIISVFIISIIMLNTNLATAVENYMNFISLENEQGISQNIVQTILQDNKGYMWFASSDGLVKYDGYRTKKYRQTPFEENTLLDNYIIDIEEDEDGDIWIGTNKGLTKLNPKEEIFTHYTDWEKINSEKISAIFNDEENNLWIGTSDSGLSKYDEKNDKFIPIKSKLTSKEITVIDEDSEGNLLIGTKYGLNKLDKETKVVESYVYNKEDDKTLSGNYINAICEDKHGDIWIGTKENGISKIDKKTDGITRYLKDENNSYSIGSNHITSIIEDKNETLWIGSSQGGLAKYDREKNHFVKRLGNPRDEGSNKQNNILELYQDRTGLIWVGLEYGGVNKFNPLASFQNYISEESFDNSMNDKNILSIYEDDKDLIWAGTKNGGVNKLDIEKRSVEYYKHDINNKNTIPSNTVNHIMKDSEGLMWFGTDNGVGILDNKTGKIDRYVDLKGRTDIKSNNINHILEDSSKDIWLGTEAGLIVYDKGKDESLYYTKENSNLSGDYITTLYEDSDNNLWIGTFHDGLSKFDKKKKEFKSYKNNPKDRTTISNDQIKSIIEDDKKNLWVGTSNGLNKLDKKTGKFKVFTEKDQLKSNFISGLLKHDNHLWISSNEGISKFDLANETLIKSYSAIDGLQGSTFNPDSVFKSPDGKLLFGGTEGLNTIYPENEKELKQVPSINLSHFKANDKEINIEDKEKIILSHKDNKLYFEFGLIDYKKPENNNHYFKLEGYDESWNDVRDSSHGVYDNMNPGNYTLKIKGVNSEGVWTEDNIDLDIVIKPPFYRTTAAYIVYILIAILMIYLIFNYFKLLEKVISERTNQLNKTNNKLLKEIKQRKKTEEVLKTTIKENEQLFKEKMEIEDFRNDFFVNLSHELRTPLNIIISTIQLGEVYLKDERAENISRKIGNHFNIMRKNCYRLLKTVNNLIDVAKLESKQYELDEKLINIVYLTEDIVASTVDYAKDKNIDIVFDTQTEETIVKCDPVEIERVVLNILSNAINYSKEKGEIKVDIYEEKENVLISVKDNGIGIPKDKQSIIFDKFKRVNGNTKLGSGIGLNLTKLLIDMHRGKLEFSSVEGEGSEFIIKLPIYDIKEHEYKDIVDLETLEKTTMDIEIEMSEIK